ncbi:MAG: hypothetical protein H7Y62_12045 [Hyphomicrobium sp.]|nr:hypothetical protein [Hyphomicrobium sp.]
MAQILSFRTPEFRSCDGVGITAGVSAEVIIFPGVRYERWKEAHAVTSAPADERRTRRDVLELAE